MEELRESEERARTIIETAADAIVTLGEDSTILSANPATERTFGYTAEELVGQQIYLLLPERWNLSSPRARRSRSFPRCRGGWGWTWRGSTRRT